MRLIPHSHQPWLFICSAPTPTRCRHFTWDAEIDGVRYVQWPLVRLAEWAACMLQWLMWQGFRGVGLRWCPLRAVAPGAPAR